MRRLAAIHVTPGLLAEVFTPRDAFATIRCLRSGLPPGAEFRWVGRLPNGNIAFVFEHENFPMSKEDISKIPIAQPEPEYERLQGYCACGERCRRCRPDDQEFGKPIVPQEDAPSAEQTAG